MATRNDELFLGVDQEQLLEKTERAFAYSLSAMKGGDLPNLAPVQLEALVLALVCTLHDRRLLLARLAQHEDVTKIPTAGRVWPPPAGTVFN